MKKQNPVLFRSNSGVTLVELLVTLVILAIVLTIGVPAFQSFAISSRLATINNELIATLAYAKSEAVKRGGGVAVCSSSTGNSCTGSWSQGWIVYLNGSPGTPLRVYRALPSNYTLNSGGGVSNPIVFGRDGASWTNTNYNVPSTGEFAVCYNGDTSTARGVVLTLLRIRAATDTDGDGIINTDSGNIGSCTNP